MGADDRNVDDDRLENPDDVQSEDGDGIPGVDTDHDVIPVTPARRRLSRIIGVAFLVGILLFLILFIVYLQTSAPGGTAG